MGARVVSFPAAMSDVSRALQAAGQQLRAAGLFPAAEELVERRPAIPVFVIGRANRCPDCHGEAFAVGRITAECCGCGLPLAIVASRRIM
ncbi:MAG: hypothetical protein KAF42_08455 [Sphingopyxis terrae]|nr:hypothetical protein [Sphingopyxis terrae]